MEDMSGDGELVVPGELPVGFQTSVVYDFRKNLFDGLTYDKDSERIKAIFLEELEKRKSRWRDYGIVAVEDVEGPSGEVRVSTEFDEFFKRQYFKMVAFHKKFSKRVEKEITGKRYIAGRTSTSEFNHPSYYKALSFCKHNIPQNRIFFAYELDGKDTPDKRGEIINNLPEEIRGKVIEVYGELKEMIFDEKGDVVAERPFSSEPAEDDMFEQVDNERKEAIIIIDAPIPTGIKLPYNVRSL